MNYSIFKKAVQVSWTEAHMDWMIDFQIWIEYCPLARVGVVGENRDWLSFGAIPC
jgi:hypothetical protein